ncbi:hypothetical protein [Saccharomonospora piscinae]|uniref:Rv3212 family protein n=1 Tax=Saccharomonospora piscinae TaxID=687388 RepID=UPI000465097F|nr:hypothetical protein [Saccharomonospora piscinae]
MSTPSGRPSEHTPAARTPGTEDVLAAAGPQDAGPGRAIRVPGTPGRPGRSPWNRRRDRFVAAALALVCVAGGAVLWLVSDSRATTQRTTTDPPARLEPPSAVPGSLAERWRAPSEATDGPVAVGGSAVTASDGTVAGRDPMTGEIRWSYSRDLALCATDGAWSKVVAVYRKGEWCGEVTQLDPATGARTAQRNGDAEAPTTLVVGEDHVTTTGTRLLNTWRSDLVKTLEYGRVPAPVNPGRQPRPECRYSTVAAGSGLVAVIEHCPRETGARLTVLRAAGDEADEPEQVFSSLLPEMSAQVVAVSDERVAVALPERRQLYVFDHDGRRQATHDLAVPEPELAAVPESGVAATAAGRDSVFWFTGSRTVALTGDDLRPRWTVEDTLGAGTAFAGEYVVPIAGGLAVLDERTGETTRTVAVDRGGSRAPVSLSAAGPVLLEQRGATVVALR